MTNDYPKVISVREGWGMTSTWKEYLRLSQDDDGRAMLEVCRYEALAETPDDEDWDGPLPEEIDGKKVVGVEDDYIVGGELARWDDRTLTYSAADIDRAIRWIGSLHFKLTDDLIREVREAVAAK